MVRRDKGNLKYRQLYELLNRKEILKHMSSYAMVELADGTTRQPTDHERSDPNSHLPVGAQIYQRMRLASPGHSTTGRSVPYTWNNIRYPCPAGEHWRVSMEGMQHLDMIGRLDAANTTSQLRWKQYENEIPGRRINNLWHNQILRTTCTTSVETAESVIERCILMATDPGDLVLDPPVAPAPRPMSPKSGDDDGSPPIALLSPSLTPASVSFPASSTTTSFRTPRKAQGRKSNSPAARFRPAFNETYQNDPAKGFVYERVPTVSAAILAYGENAPPTLLVNRPLKKRATRRVSSAFTVESHSPYRILHPDQVDAALPADSVLHQSLLSCLEAAGIHDGDARIPVTGIEPYPGDSGDTPCITHTGHTPNGKAAIAIARDDASVSTGFINVAAEQAIRHPSIKILIVVGFHFEADAYSSHAEIRGRLAIYKAHANQDFRVGNLKEDRNHHAFTRIGEPSLEIHPEDDGRISVEVTGHDTYDPATGQLASGDAKDIHCWMIDINYNGTAFFAHRIHFPGARNDDQLKRFAAALGRRIDPVLWKHALSTKSAPFSRPATGRIAVRIITNTHTEMTAVVDVSRA